MRRQRGEVIAKRSETTDQHAALTPLTPLTPPSRELLLYRRPSACPWRLVPWDVAAESVAVKWQCRCRLEPGVDAATVGHRAAGRPRARPLLAPAAANKET